VPLEGRAFTLAWKRYPMQRWRCPLRLEITATNERFANKLEPYRDGRYMFAVDGAGKLGISSQDRTQP
jgi:hypothetical protein